MHFIIIRYRTLMEFHIENFIFLFSLSYTVKRNITYCYLNYLENSSLTAKKYVYGEKNKKKNYSKFLLKERSRFQFRSYQIVTYKKNSFNTIAIASMKISERSHFLMPTKEWESWLSGTKNDQKRYKNRVCETSGIKVIPRVHSCPWMVISGLIFFFLSQFYELFF